jgi:hypothetical protein
LVENCPYPDTSRSAGAEPLTLFPFSTELLSAKGGAEQHTKLAICSTDLLFAKSGAKHLAYLVISTDLLFVLAEQLLLHTYHITLV